MARLIILIAVAGIGLILWHKITKAPADERKKLIFWSIISIVVGILGILAVTGHLNVITAAIAALVALAPRAMQFLKYLPFISRLYKQQGQSGNNEQHSAPPQRKQAMSAEEAMDILGLKTGYTDENVKLAHRRMMQKNHPDRGGSDYLAAQINTAKDVLLG
ncbi:DnaJ domain protein [hydrothermal vent metagenome]|uniref:DnaJ domain protein n=1 Tax=hydrothermal vent metagenome TaxID=652676 RepID=A0A3B0WUD3_9ZZZZ